MGDLTRTFNRGGQILIGEFAGDVVTRFATKFGGANMLAQLRVPPQFVQPALRIAVGLFAPMLLKMAPRLFRPDFRATFGAVNVASGLIGLTQNMRAQLFETMGLSDWETAAGGVGDSAVAYHLSDWETADNGVGGYELAQDYGPPAGVLGADGPPAGVLDGEYAYAM